MKFIVIVWWCWNDHRCFSNWWNLTKWMERTKYWNLLERWKQHSKLSIDSYCSYSLVLGNTTVDHIIITIICIAFRGSSLFFYYFELLKHHYLCVITVFVIRFEVTVNGRLVLLDQLGGGYGRPRPLRRVGIFGSWFFIDWMRLESISRRVTSRDKRPAQPVIDRTAVAIPHQPHNQFNWLIDIPCRPDFPSFSYLFLLFIHVCLSNRGGDQNFNITPHLNRCDIQCKKLGKFSLTFYLTNFNNTSILFYRGSKYVEGKKTIKSI